MRAGKKKVQQELEDTNIDLEAQRAKVLELEKKQKSFDKVRSCHVLFFFFLLLQ